MCIFKDHLGSRTVNNLPTMQEIQFQSLGREDSLEKGMATHSSILAWKILCEELIGGLQYMGSQRVGHDLATKNKAECQRIDAFELWC